MLFTGVSGTPRTFWLCEHFAPKHLIDGQLVADYQQIDPEDRFEVDFASANLVSSLLEHGWHAPALDIDHQASLSGNDLSIIVNEAGIGSLADQEVEGSVQSLSHAKFIRSASFVPLTADTARVTLCLTAPAHLLASTTSGHFHLYSETELDWASYFYNILAPLQCLGVLEGGFVDVAMQREMSLLLKPQVTGQMKLFQITS